MATNALLRRSLTQKRVYRPVNRTRERIFFSTMAGLLCVAVVIGFSRTYFLAGMMRAPLPDTLVHIHGAVFSLWMVIYLVQTALIAAGRVAWHRSLGILAFCLVPIMVVLGVITSIDGLRRGVSIGPLGAAPALSISMLGMVIFPILIFASWRARRRPDAHKRLILIATLSLVEAGFGRFPWRQLGLTPAVGAMVSLGSFLLILVAYDLISLHRVHRSTMWAAPLTFAFLALAVPIGMSPPWKAFTGFLARNVAPHL